MDNLKELGQALISGLTPWMRFALLLAILILITAFYLKGDIVEYAKYRASINRKFEPVSLSAEESVIVQEMLKTLAMNAGSDGSGLFGYQPLHNIQTKSLISAYQKPGNIVLNPVRFSDIPITIDAGEFIAMKNQELYHFDQQGIRASPIWARMSHQGVAEVFSYPLISSGILYGNLSLVYADTCCIPPVAYIKENLRTTAGRIIEVLKL